MKMITIVTVLLLTMTFPGFAGAKKDDKAAMSYKRGICGEISNYVDALLYENPPGHGSITSCSYTDSRLLVKPNLGLTQKLMKSFVFLTFSAVGALRNDDYILPDKIYVGYGADCQVLTAELAARLQYAANYGGQLGLSHAMIWALDAPKVPCPK